ncbi:MAG: TatD family hydrolase [Sandaracinobacteroides sp.]
MLIDSHCHLNYPGLVEDEAGVVARATAAGIDAMISISTREREWTEVVAGAERNPTVFATVGIHPHEADEHPDIDTARLVEAARHPKVIGIGETGLDYFYDKSDRERQRRSFGSHVAASRETGLPLIVHTRDAEDDTIAILTDEMGRGAFPMVIHCFTGSQKLAEACLELGAYISLSGIVTFKNAKELQATARTVPADRILVETDSPFLSPVPMRGKLCEPAYVVHTARYLAELRGENAEAFFETTRLNTLQLFSRIRIPCA